MRPIFVTIFTICAIGILSAQTDSLPGNFKKIDLLPAISYTPETELTFGVIGYYYFNLARQSAATRLSNINFLAAYTLANQRVIEFRWDVFSDANNWRYRGELFFNRFPDRNYGLGNEAGLLIADVEDGAIDTLNYVRFNSDRLKFSPVVLRRVGTYLYLGLQGDMEYLYNLKPTGDSYFPLDEESERLLDFPVDGLRVGIGLNLLHDSRDNILNPLTGTYVEVSNHFYSTIFGSDFDFSNIRLDGRRYVNVTSNHTLALRGVVNFRFSEEPIPLRALSRVGGQDFIRGYFRGTFQDQHLAAFELEYRWPFWKPDLEAPFWKLWKRLGVVGFLGGAQVFNETDGLALNRFNLAAGGGLRILFNKESRLNIRIDYGIGLSENSGGIGKRQSGFYFFLAEAF